MENHINRDREYKEYEKEKGMSSLMPDVGIKVKFSMNNGLRRNLLLGLFRISLHWSAKSVGLY
jgi:hypothetical protein